MSHRKDVSGILMAILLAIALSTHPDRMVAADRGIEKGDITSHPFPPYPAQALLNHETATIVLRLTINRGKLMDVSAVSGPSQFTSVAARWVKATWTFKPTVNGTYNMPIYYGVWPPKRPQKQRGDSQVPTR
jgi:hypothetical protein